MISLIFGLFTQVSYSGPQGPLVIVLMNTKSSYFTRGSATRKNIDFGVPSEK